MNNNDDSAADHSRDVQAHWGFAPPVHPVVVDAQLEDFFSNAPEATVVEYFGELYQKDMLGNWTHLEELVPDFFGNFQNESSTPEQMTARTEGGSFPVSVLRI